MTRTSGQVAERDAGDRGNLSVASREPSKRRARRRGSRSCRHTSTSRRGRRLSDMSHALNLRTDVDRQQRSRLGARRAGPERPWIRHASAGRIARYRIVGRARRCGRRRRSRWKGPNRSVVVRFRWVRPGASRRPREGQRSRMRRRRCGLRASMREGLDVSTAY